MGPNQTIEWGQIRPAKSLNLFGGCAVQHRKTCESPGLPAKAELMDIMRSRLSRALELSESYDQDDLLYAIHILGSPSDKLIEQVLGRISVARMQLPTVEAVTSVLWNAIDFGRTRLVTHDNSGRLAQADSGWSGCGSLSRFCHASSSGSVAKRRKPHSGRLLASPELRSGTTGCSSNRLEISCTELFLRSLPRTEARCFPELLNLPLPDERGIHKRAALRGAEQEWPEAMAHMPRRIARPPDEFGFASRLTALISKIRTGDAFTRERAVYRVDRSALDRNPNAARDRTFRVSTVVAARTWGRPSRRIPDCPWMRFSHFRGTTKRQSSVYFGFASSRPTGPLRRNFWT